MAISNICARVLTTAVLVSLPVASNAARAPFVTRSNTNVTRATTATCDTPGFVLGSALTPFAMLAATTITNTGNSVVAPSSSRQANDLMGVWPGTAVTGFYPPGLDAGGTNAIYASNYNTDRGTPQAAQGALLKAYNGAAALKPTALVSGDLSQAKVTGYPKGSLPPGIYKSATTMAITAGNLTLVRGNPANPPVWIFQVGTSLTTSADAGLAGNVVLGTGVDACNVFWQLGDSATIGGQSFSGDIAAYSSITLAGEYFTGRAMALNGAVTITSGGGTLLTNGGGR